MCAIYSMEILVSVASDFQRRKELAGGTTGPTVQVFLTKWDYFCISVDSLRAFFLPKSYSYHSLVQTWLLVFACKSVPR